jgi:hypothetical protein
MTDPAATDPRADLPVGPAAVIAGAGLLGVSLFLDWYDDFSAWTVFEIVDLLLLVLAAAALAGAADRLGLRARGAPGLGGALLGVSLAALVIVFVQVVNHPPAAFERDAEIGQWLALGGAALMTAGALLTTVSIRVAVAPRDRPGVDRGAPTQRLSEDELADPPGTRPPAAPDA